MSSFTDFRFGYPHAIYGSMMFSMLIEVLLSLMKVPLKIWRRSCYTLWTFGLTRLIPLICWQMPVWILQVHRSCQLSCHPSHLNLCSVHLTIFLVVMLGFLVVKLPPCLSKHLFGKLLSQGLYLQLCEILLLFFFLRVSGIAGTFFFFSLAPSMVSVRKRATFCSREVVLMCWSEIIS